MPRFLRYDFHSLFTIHAAFVRGLGLTIGLLTCLDGYMNVALEQTEEYVNGQLKRKYGDCFVRGNNVLYIRRL